MNIKQSSLLLIINWFKIDSFAKMIWREIVIEKKLYEVCIFFIILFKFRVLNWQNSIYFALHIKNQILYILNLRVSIF